MSSPTTNERGRSVLRGRIPSLALFAIGAVLANFWALADFGVASVVAVAGFLTGLAALAGNPFTPAPWRILAQVLLACVHAAWIAVVFALAGILAWSVPAWFWLLVALMLGLSVATRARSLSPQVPLVLPIGMIIAALAYGWMREDGLIRCDDYFRVKSVGGEVIVSSTPELASCVPGESLSVSRYPRLLWDDPRDERILFTTQRGDHYFSPWTPAARRVESWLGGAVCEAEVGGQEPPTCFAEGKADAILDSVGRDRLYTTAHDATTTTIYEMTRTKPVRILAEKRLPTAAGILYIDERAGIIALGEDKEAGIHFVRAADLVTVGSVGAGFVSTLVHYDQESGEGVICRSGRAGMTMFSAVGFRGDPFSYRPLALSTTNPSSLLAATWGCDWSHAERRVFVAIASLGIVQIVDYDSGTVLNWAPARLGIRTVAYDSDRNLIYVGTFFGGDIFALDARTLAIKHRWFAGRFVRHIRIARDGHFLLASSTLGIVRLPLAPQIPVPASARPT